MSKTWKVFRVFKPMARMRSVLKQRKGQLKIASLMNKPKPQKLGDNLLKVAVLANKCTLNDT